MSVSIEIREHSTADIDFQLLSGGDAIDLTGVDHIEMEMRDSKRGVYSYSSTGAVISIQDATTGKVRYSPPNNTIFQSTKSPYKGYWRVWTTAAKHYTVPEDSEWIIYVREEY